MDPAIKKSLTLKTNSVKRLLKEYKMYEKEYKEIETKLNLLKEVENIDPYEIKKTVKNKFITYKFFIFQIKLLNFFRQNIWMNLKVV